ncbi:unnamed protein product [Mytilus coruscus]|uniref:Fibrinogen C-terminal domain-containing protein n=1 Tax=Mytilus coruscus TaxID=42192 RepID=A0A6J8E722_MYTCO|nr:unnamed protein product [Mytilus coruscus]
MTSVRNTEMRVDMENFKGEKRYAKYSTFKIGYAASKYKLTIGGYSGNAGDAFAASNHNGNKFTTPDQDNDKYKANCASYGSRVGSGWWFNSCESVCFTLSYTNNKEGLTGESLIQIRKMEDAITKEESNYMRIAHLILRVAPTAVRIKFDAEFHPSGLRIVLNQNRFKYIEPLRQKRVINQKQWDLLFPVSGMTCSETFDVTLMICLIRNLTNITVVDTCPHLNDTSAGADLSRIKYYRNRITHSDSGTITDADFITYWQDITQALIRLGGRSYQEKCNDLRSSKFDKSDKEIITELRNIVLSSDPIPKGVRSIHVVKICEWKVIEEKVVETSSMKNIEQELQTHDVVTVVGPGGCGKSTSIHHVALLLESKFGYNIVPLNSPADILRYYNPDCICG